MKIISIDPGLKGAIAFIENGTPLKFMEMPTTMVNSKKRVDLGSDKFLFHMFNPDYFVVEHVGASPQMGSAAAFGFGYSFGGILGVIEGMQKPYALITPQKWKAVHGLLGKEKDASRQLVLKMFPDHADEFKRKKDNDKAEALLIGLAAIQLGSIG